MARRSARLSKADQSSTDVNKPLPEIPQLESVNEDDEADAAEKETHATPRAESNMKKQLKRTKSLSTPKTEPRPANSEMPADPKTIHQTTMPPDSGMKLGFVDISTKKRQSATGAQNTPSRSNQKATQPATAPAVNFKFVSEAVLSNEAQQMMENVREEAARIKAEMKAQKDLQDQKDGEAEGMFAGRKIAKPKAKVGRFSDIHMAEFKKMDSIADHPSSFRARLGYAAPTSQSLKRTPSKAGLDEPQRPRTAGKGTPGRAPPPFPARKSSESPFKSIPQPVTSDRLENTAPAKRVRRSEAEDVSSSRPREVEISKPSGIPKTVTTNSLFSPTKSSLARTQSATTSPAKASILPRSQTVKGMRDAGRMSINRTTSAVSRFTSKLLEAQQESRKNSPLLSRSKSINDLSKIPSLPQSSTTAAPSSFSSKLPTFSGLKSILRSPRKESAILAERQDTPKRPNTSAGVVESPKKVDFTPSVKSRYAVKMANNSPSPAKLAQSTTSDRTRGPVVPFDPAAYVIDNGQDDSWEDASDESIEYPNLPPLSAEPSPRVGPVTHTVAQKAKETGVRESKEFKSIFTTLHHPSRPTSSGSMASVSSAVSRTSTAIPQPPHMAGRVIAPLGRASRPSTIRRVRSSGSNEVIQPFEDTEVTTMAHGLPAKKRRRESQYFDTQESAEESKENMPVADQWKESDPAEDEGAKRAKKVKTLDFKDIEANEKQISPKKKSAAREAAARNARERKSMAPGQPKTSTPAKGAITMSRLQMLSQPKRRD